MSKYYKAEDIQELIIACAWRMTLAKERNGNGFIEYDKQIIDVGEFRKRLSNLPSIDVVHCEECKYDGTWKCPWRNTQVPRYPSADDFCSYGERIDNE